MKALIGQYISLIPLDSSYQHELQNAANNEEIFAFASNKAFGEHFESWWETGFKLHEKGEHIVFVVIRNSDQAIIGCTRFYDYSTQHRRLAIGYTWYITEVWGRGYNLEVKYLMLEHAFTEMAIQRVELIANHLNVRSQKAIQKIGAKLEGVLRSHIQSSLGERKDTHVFSILKSEWEADGRENLVEKINKAQRPEVNN
ncbi:MAG: GNAT family N-acetyltransferase [Saprospiraceae bacterium]